MSLSFSIPSESFPVFEGTLRDSKSRKKKKIDPNISNTKTNCSCSSPLEYNLLL